jgi:GT2 family glycosyltransferase
MSEPFFSVVIPTFRRPEALRAAVAALLVQDYPRSRLELIVVDDEGQGRAQSVLTDLACDGVVVSHESQDRGGAARARNRGARRAEGEIVLFVDDDIIVSPDHLRRHARTLAASGRALVNGAWVFSPMVLTTLRDSPFGRFRIDLEQRFQEEANRGEASDGIIDMEMLGSWNLSLSRDLFDEIGGFDEEFPVAGAEDQEFSLRAKAAGCRLLLDTKIVCLHNDNRLDLRSYCSREERSARTMPIIARKFPEHYGESAYVLENRPISRDDAPLLILKKLAKAVLASGPVLALLHRLIPLAEASPIPESALRRAYSAMLGLHLYRGFRQSLRADFGA